MTPVGLCGQVTLMSLVCGVIAAATAPSRSGSRPRTQIDVVISQPIARGVSRLVA